MSACQRENMVIIRSKTLVLAAGARFRQETLPAVFAGNNKGDRAQPKEKKAQKQIRNGINSF